MNNLTKPGAYLSWNRKIIKFFRLTFVMPLELQSYAKMAKNIFSTLGWKMEVLPT
jgi:hypothetical protein